MRLFDRILSFLRPSHSGSTNTPVHSSLVASIGYDAMTSDLTVEFTGGGVYVYHDVPKKHFDEMKRLNRSGGSVGHYFSAKVRGGPYTFTRLA